MVANSVRSRPSLWQRGLTDCRIRPSWRQAAAGPGRRADCFSKIPCLSRTCRCPRIPRAPSAATSCRSRGRPPLPDRVLRAMDTPIIDHRGPEFAKLAKTLPRRHQDHLQDHQPGDHLHRDRHRRVGGGAGQHALARRPRADGRDRPVRHAVEEHGREARPQARVHRDRLAHRRRPGGDRGPSAQGHEQGDQGGLRAAQRDLDRLPLADRRDPQGDRRRRPSGAVPGRHHLLARLDRLPPRRVGRRRHHRRRAEGADAAARHVVQRGQRQGAGGVEEFEADRSRSGHGTTCST